MILLLLCLIYVCIYIYIYIHMTRILYSAIASHISWKTRRNKTRNSCRRHPAVDQLQRLPEPRSSGLPLTSGPRKPCWQRTSHPWARSPLDPHPSSIIYIYIYMYTYIHINMQIYVCRFTFMQICNVCRYTRTGCTDILVQEHGLHH